MTDSFVNNKGSLEERVSLFNQMALPGQPLGIHMGTSYLVNDLMREIQELREALKPFAEAETENEAINSDETVLWEQSASGNIVYGDLRRARAKIVGGEK